LLARKISLLNIICQILIRLNIREKL